MRNNFVCLLLVGLYATNALGSEAALSGISVGELGKVQSETILFKAKAERDKAQKDVEAAGRTPSPNSLPLMQPLTEPSSRTEPSGLPVIRSISGSARQLQAALLYSTGIEIDAVSGRNLPGGFRVAEVTLDGVVLERDGVRYTLGFSSQVPSTARQQAPIYPRTGSLLPGIHPVEP